MFTILSEAEGGRRGGRITLDLTKWDFDKADCRNKGRKMVENLKPLLLIGSPIDSASGRDKEQPVRAVLHLAFICELYEMQEHGGQYFLHTHSHSADSWEQSTVVDLMNRFSDTFLVWHKCPSRYEHADEMVDKFWLHRTGTQLIDSVRQTITSAMSQQLESDLCASGTTDPRQHCPPPPKLDILAVRAGEAPPEQWEAADDVKGGPLDPREVKTARQKETQYLWDREVYEYATKAEARARTGRNPVGLKWIDTNKRQRRSPTLPLVFGVYGSAPQRGVEPTFSATPQLETLPVLLSVACQEDVFRVEDPFLISIADLGRAHFHAVAVVTSTFDCWTRTPRQKTRRVWEIAKDNVRLPGCSTRVEVVGGEGGG